MEEMKKRVRTFFETRGFTVTERRGVRPPSFYVEKEGMNLTEFQRVLGEVKDTGIKLMESFSPEFAPGKFSIWLSY